MTTSAPSAIHVARVIHGNFYPAHMSLQTINPTINSPSRLDSTLFGALQLVVWVRPAATIEILERGHGLYATDRILVLSFNWCKPRVPNHYCRRILNLYVLTPSFFHSGIQIELIYGSKLACQ